MHSTLTRLFAAFAALFLLPVSLLAYHSRTSGIKPPRPQVRFHPTREANWVRPAKSHKIKYRQKRREVAAKKALRRLPAVLIKEKDTPALQIKQIKSLTSQVEHSPEIPTSVVTVIREDAVHPQVTPTEEVVASAEIVPGLYDGRGHLNMPAALRGSREILIHQNQMADQDGLTRIQDDDDLLQMRQKKMLVALPINEGLRIDERLPVNRRFCRPWVAQFLLEAGRAHYAQFHVPLQINSAVRTVSFQVRLMRTNGNAAQADGEAASPHLTGQAIDIGKKSMSQGEIAWMRLYLIPLLDDGRIDVEEEFQQACFHLSVYKRYAPMSVTPQRIIATHRTVTPALASALE